jgi:hydrogenase/urease accessory protein HupE
VAVAPPAPVQAPVAAQRAGRTGWLMLGVFVLFCVIVSLLAIYAAPIIMCIESPIAILIVGFALWQAWKLNTRRPLVFNGPFRIGETGDSNPLGTTFYA